MAIDVRLSSLVLSYIIDKISFFEGLKLRLLPAKDIPKRPRVRIRMSLLEESGEKLLRYITLQNKSVTGIDDY